MLPFKTYLQEEYYTFETYCVDVDVASKIVFSPSELSEELIAESLSGLRKEITEILKLIRDHFAEAGSDLKISASQIASAFKSKSIYESLKYFGFSIRSIFKSIQDVTSIPSDTLIKLFQDLRSLEAVRSLDKRGEVFDQFLQKHPIIKRLTGPVIAALLILTWLNMSFTGNLKHDMDIANWFKSLKGQFSVKELFISSKGMSMTTFLLTGLISGGALSFTWLGASVYNLMLAIAYIVIANANISTRNLRRIKDYVLSKIRGT